MRQPREAVRRADLLEIPAGKLDEEGESPLRDRQRELAEEIGKAAEHWEHAAARSTPRPGFTDERFHLFAATGLRDAPPQAEEDERIEIVRWPLDRLDEAIAECHDSKSLIGLLSLAQQLGRRGPSGPA